ncbi:hypothetical protein A8H37_33680 [Burkholderia thailandensis]|nr:hypothetical protein A8H37_33680 [Burkholderia thailandensis]
MHGKEPAGCRLLQAHAGAKRRTRLLREIRTELLLSSLAARRYREAHEMWLAVLTSRDGGEWRWV